MQQLLPVLLVSFFFHAKPTTVHHHVINAYHAFIPLKCPSDLST